MKNIFVHHTAMVDPGAAIGNGSKIWHYCHVMSKARIGNNCSLGQNVFVADEAVLGNNVKVQNNVSIYTGIICEDNVFLGPSMVFTNVVNPRSNVNRKNQYTKTILKSGATIGAAATIVCGNRIGENAFVGAGSIVVDDVPDYALVVGNPGRIIGWMSEFGERLCFDHNNEATCIHSKSVYHLKNGIVEKA